MCTKVLRRHPHEGLTWKWTTSFFLPFPSFPIFIAYTKSASSCDVGLVDSTALQPCKETKTCLSLLSSSLRKRLLVTKVFYGEFCYGEGVRSGRWQISGALRGERRMRKPSHAKSVFYDALMKPLTCCLHILYTLSSYSLLLPHLSFVIVFSLVDQIVL